MARFVAPRDGSAVFGSVAPFVRGSSLRPDLPGLLRSIRIGLRAFAGSVGAGRRSVVHGPLVPLMLRRPGRWHKSTGPPVTSALAGESKSAGAVRLRRSQIPPREPPSRGQSQSMGRENRLCDPRPARGSGPCPDLCGARRHRPEVGPVESVVERCGRLESNVRSRLAEPRQPFARGQDFDVDAWRDLGRCGLEFGSR